MWAFLHRLASPRHFYHLTGRWIPWLGGATLLCMAAGLYLGLWVAPPDYQQGDSFRIMYVHVPAAWLSLFIYVFMAVAGGIGLIWNMKMADVMAVCSAPVGASFTFLALATGSIWGKPMWGTWWVWDARLTSELILLFLYLGYIALQSAIEDPRTAARAGAILAIVGSVNIPIIHYSVEWWNTLHQGPTVTRFDKPAIHPSMLWPLLLMAFAFQLYFFTVLLLRARSEILWRERRSRWVRELLARERIEPVSDSEEIAS
ncbi:heme exporter protein C [Methylomarinovum tepidoasis]|uniref:Heme exporter protein C n=1 Tax=Methylomarinovum tepidoasis TaxID=2840183 RepID=A0AAU9CMM4_9GAMM|nr:heme ABC transporter permease [Methylomarinovum sp. IN45]BCX88882.1 heme exporter protein C [Methylomarinovum sp. IN45]